MATAPVGNIANLLDPTLVGDTQANAQQQALAQLLLQEGYTPMQNTQMAGNVALRNSPTQSMAKIAQILSGQNMQQSANAQASQLAARQSAALLPLYFGQGQQQPQPQDPSQQPGPQPAPMQGQPTQAPPGVNMSTPGPMTIPGADPRQAFLASQTYPQQYGDAFVKSMTPNDTSIQAMQGGMNPQIANRMMFLKASTDPKILAMRQAGMTDGQVYDAVFGESAKNAEISRRPGEGYSNGLTGEAGMVGKIPEGANVVGPPGRNGQVSLTPMPGNTSIVAGNSAAQGLGASQNNMTTVTLDNGKTQNMTQAQAVQYANGQSNPSAYNFSNGGLGAAGSPQMRAQIAASGDYAALGAFDKQASGSQGMPGFTSGQTPADKASSESGANTIVGRNQAIIADANAAPQDIESLTRMNELAGSSNFGPGASTSAKWQALASQVPGMGLIVNPTTLQQQQTNVTLMKKYMSGMAGRMSGASGTGTDARLQNAIDSLPNDAAPDAAIKVVAPMLIAQRTARMDEANLRTPLGNNPAAISNFESQWRNAYNPLAYEATIATKGMTPQATIQYVQSHYTPAQAAEIMQSRQKLGQLGATFGQ